MILESLRSAPDERSCVGDYTARETILKTSDYASCPLDECFAVLAVLLSEDDLDVGLTLSLGGIVVWFTLDSRSEGR